MKIIKSHFFITILSIVIFFFLACSDHIHDWGDWKVLTEAACTKAGEEIRTCKTDSTHTETRVNRAAPALGHNKNDLDTGICGRCQALYYKIGDTGPGGGKIFYVADGLEGRPLSFTMMDNQQKCYYLEAAPADLSFGLAMAPATSPAYIYDIPEVKYSGIGDGRQNTKEVLKAAAGDTATNAPAAHASSIYTNNGKNDWFIPSRYEMVELNKQKSIFQNWGTSLNLPLVSGQPADYILYWTSTQAWFNDGIVYTIDFEKGGHWLIASTGIFCYTRVIRAF